MNTNICYTSCRAPFVVLYITISAKVINVRMIILETPEHRCFLDPTLGNLWLTFVIYFYCYTITSMIFFNISTSQFQGLVLYWRTLGPLCPKNGAACGVRWSWHPLPESAPKITPPRSFHKTPRDLWMANRPHRPNIMRRLLSVLLTEETVTVQWGTRWQPSPNCSN